MNTNTKTEHHHLVTGGSMHLSHHLDDSQERAQVSRREPIAVKPMSDKQATKVLSNIEKFRAALRECDSKENDNNVISTDS